MCQCPFQEFFVSDRVKVERRVTFGGRVIVRVRYAVQQNVRLIGGFAVVK